MSAHLEKKYKYQFPFIFNAFKHEIYVKINSIIVWLLQFVLEGKWLIVIQTFLEF